ncbi:MAG: long-chain acyl-CoA synthetase [Myxococcota bacterium]|jgi:long-chain acyl-CoA synthetase
MNLMMLLEMASSSFGDRVALTNGDDQLTYEELFKASGAAGARAKASGADYFAMLDESSLAFPTALFGAAWAGIPFVPLNYRLTGNELDALLTRVESSILLCEPERTESLLGRDKCDAIGRHDFLAEARKDGAPSLDPEWSMDPEEIAVLLFTSGTTGAPKAAVLRHQHIVSYILSTVEFMSADEDAAQLVCVPPYHIAGIASLASSIYSGRRIVQLPAFTPESWIETARREKISNAMVVPTMLARIIEALEGQGSADLPDLKAISYGGGKMPQAVVERAMELFPDTNFTNAYGLTETSSTISILGPDDHRAAMASEDPAVRKRITSVGQPIPTIEVEIRDDDGKALGADERGEIYVRGEQVSGEYLGKGSQLLADGFFPTKDGGYLDAEGYLFLEGRIDDIIVRGGENMSPGEIEDVMLEHEAVSDVAVIGIPDEQWGEAVVAAVVLKGGKAATEGELQQWVKERLRSSRTPEQIRFTDELPYNETGKLLRREVRASFAE